MIMDTHTERGSEESGTLHVVSCTECIVLCEVAWVYFVLFSST